MRSSQAIAIYFEFKKIHFTTEDYDYDDDYNVFTIEVPTAESSMFAASVTGVINSKHLPKFREQHLKISITPDCSYEEIAEVLLVHV